ncbi:hypothetical protein B0T16DRAFT_459715 [Cercophora newfieldiana]|uniref:Uncharacterized protein n=1 Tax=Cercophora newfieldiana TaxID=92897 RepID=A0AA39Y1V9_9PEZI|nr:hypothetical protein B0T16DRAFT_459715 [Cercophora newfieldiana]
MATSSPISPRSLFHQPPLPTPQVPPSPYLSEEAHVHSLQHPPPSPGQKDDAAGWLAPKHRRVSSSNIPHLPLLEEVSPGASASESRSVFPNLSWRKNSIARLKIKEKKSLYLESNTVSEAPAKPIDAVEAVAAPLVATPIEQNPGNKIENLAKTGTVERAPSTASRSRRIRFGRGGSWHSTRDHKRSDSSATDTIVTKPRVPIEEISKAALLIRPQLWATQFPGGEATRVNTPPLKEDVPDGRPRGLFFDVSGPSSEQPQQGSESASSLGPNQTPHPRQDDRDPFDQRVPGRRREW